MFCGSNEAECYRASPSASTDERAAQPFSARGFFRAQTFAGKKSEMFCPFAPYQSGGSSACTEEFSGRFCLNPIRENARDS
jgi:hypothetical protein